MKTIVVLLSFALVLSSISFAGPSYYSDSASFNAVTNITVSEDFESVFPRNTALASFTSQGITYAGVGGTNVWIAGLPIVYNNFGVPLTSSVLTATGPENFTVSLVLVSPVTAIGFDTYLNASGPATITISGSNGVIDTYSLLHPSNQVGFFGVTSNDPITLIQWTTTGGERVNTGIDNVLVGNVVPAPGALLLGSMGMAMVGWLRRKQSV